MTTNDFAWMWQGIHQRPLQEQDIHLLSPIEIKKNKFDHAIVLIHGFSSTPAVFRHFLKGLEDYDGIFVPVLPGHAVNLEAFSQVDAQQWVEYICAYVKKITKMYHKVDVLGLSLGGLLAYVVSQKMKIHHLYLLAPAFYLRLPIKTCILLSKTLPKIGIRSIRNHGGNINCQTEAELGYKRLPVTTIHTILTLIHQYQFSPPSCPVDVFLGKHDIVINNSKVEKIFKKQKARIHCLDHSAHVLPLDRDREKILKTIQKNLRNS